ncbi:hypothetical protein F511_30529 [Dorcoceras hygrometricum]|uniref:Uncharacterized protein n=1 Tax=Dorcoceras hygrometricum TaxID=472368 RepID=A0A2Z7B9B4_9LAMI|nr:hypothetical protein F511_30529 [Dorcoceras hygrometricum]
MARFMMVLGWSRGGPWLEDMVARRLGRAMKHARRKVGATNVLLSFVVLAEICASCLELWLVHRGPADPGVVLPTGLRPVVVGGGRTKGCGRRRRGEHCMGIEHDEPLASLGLNGAGDDRADEYIPTGHEDL